MLILVSVCGVGCDFGGFLIMVGLVRNGVVFVVVVNFVENLFSIRC